MEQEDIIDYKNKWLFDITKKPVPQSSELSFGRIKAYLYESLRRYVSRHNTPECFKLLRILPKETSLDPYVLFRFVFILIESNPTEKLNKNVLIHLESLFSRLDLCRPEVFVEFLSYFMRHNRIVDARELFGERHKYMDYRIHRPMPYIDVNLRCYEFMLNYVDWSDKVSRANTKLSFDVSMQGWIVNAIESLKSTISNHEYFAICLTQVLLFYNFTKKAYLFVSEFQRFNPDNISAQLLHYNLLELIDSIPDRQEIGINDPDIDMDCSLTEEERDINRSNELKTINNFSSNIEDEAMYSNRYPLIEDRKSVLKNIHRLDPSRGELIDLKNTRQNPIQALMYSLDGLEVVNEVRDIKRWLSIKNLLEDILSQHDEALMTEARILWQTKYATLWTFLDFLAIAGNQISSDDRKVIEEVLSLLDGQLNCEI